MANTYIVQSGKIPSMAGDVMGQMPVSQCQAMCDSDPTCTAFYRSSDSAQGIYYRAYEPPRFERRRNPINNIEENVETKPAEPEYNARGKCWKFNIIGLDKSLFSDDPYITTYIKSGSSDVESLQKDPSSGKMRIVSTNEDLFTQLQKLEKMRDKLIYKEAQLSSQRDVNSETARIQSIENDKVLQDINREIALTKRKLEYKYQEELYYNSKVFLLGNILFYIFIALIVFCIYLFINEKMGSMEYIKNALQNIKDQFLEFIYKFKSNVGGKK